MYGDDSVGVILRMGINRSAAGRLVGFDTLREENGSAFTAQLTVSTAGLESKERRKSSSAKREDEEYGHIKTFSHNKINKQGWCTDRRVEWRQSLVDASNA